MSDALSHELSAPLVCDQCGYDLRAQPADGKCPECGTAVEESRRLALFPRRPAWRDSDRRWRRRILTGVWILTLVPLVSAMKRTGWSDAIPLPTFTRAQGAHSLGDAFINLTWPHLMFCMGVALLFAKERGRRFGRLDGTRRWGVVASYGVLLLGVAEWAFVTSLVGVGIAALFQSLPPSNQPAVTGLIREASITFLWYWPYPSHVAIGALAGCSAIVVLLACVPLFNALRSCGSKVVAMAVLAPLLLSAVVQLAYAPLLALDLSGIEYKFMYERLFFFNARLLGDVLIHPGVMFSTGHTAAETIKWLACLAIATWLSVAQIAARWRRAGGKVG